MSGEYIKEELFTTERTGTEYRVVRLEGNNEDMIYANNTLCGEIRGENELEVIYYDNDDDNGVTVLGKTNSKAEALDTITEFDFGKHGTTWTVTQKQVTENYQEFLEMLFPLEKERAEMLYEQIAYELENSGDQPEDFDSPYKPEYILRVNTRWATFELEAVH